MFQHLDRLAPDGILGLMAAFRADDHPHKVDLGVGVYRDDRGDTPVLASVREAERRVLAAQSTKSYVAAAGNPGFNTAIERLVLGADHPAVTAGRVRTLQTVGGCGALRVGAELIRLAAPRTVVHVSLPTWANHVPLLSGCGLALERYPYFDAATGAVDFASMCASLERLPEGAAVLLHAACHNPTGADLTDAQWRELLPLFSRRRLLPFIDIAYQGLGRSIDADAGGLRLFCGELPEVLVAVSCSKNFGLYRERVGALHLVSASAQAAEAGLTQLVRIARSLYSMPPDHGAAIVHAILTTAVLDAQWRAEVDGMRERIHGLRDLLVRQLKEACPDRDFEFVRRQRGMFTYLGITPEQVRALRERHHIYMTEDSRINVAGLRRENAAYVAAAVAEVLERVPAA